MTLGELQRELQKLADEHGSDVQVYLDAPGVTTPEVIVKAAGLLKKSVYLTANFPPRFR